MRRIFFSLVLTTILHTVAQAQGAARTLKPCALLTPEVVKNVSVASKKNTNPAAPTEMQLGAGLACVWGEITLQVDPVTPAQLEKLPKTSSGTWEPVKGVGDAAWFHNVRDMIGELFVRVGGRTFGVLIEIPVGSTAAAFKPNFITVANAIVPKLR